MKPSRGGHSREEAVAARGNISCSYATEVGQRLSEVVFMQERVSFFGVG